MGLGRAQGELGGIWREWLAWHDASGNPSPLPHELIQRQKRQLQQEQQRAEQMQQELELERREKQRLLEQLRQLGVEVEGG
ncbi:MAG: hypothetical protein ACKO24_15880 [Leptolyngbyaceae cyanobacterium]